MQLARASNFNVDVAQVTGPCWLCESRTPGSDHRVLGFLLIESMPRNSTAGFARLGNLLHSNQRQACCLDNRSSHPPLLPRLIVCAPGCWPQQLVALKIKIDVFLEAFRNVNFRPVNALKAECLAHLISTPNEALRRCLESTSCLLEKEIKRTWRYSGDEYLWSFHRMCRVSSVVDKAVAFFLCS